MLGVAIVMILGAVLAEDYTTQTKVLSVLANLMSYQSIFYDRHSFPTQSFEIIKGLLMVKFEKIIAGTNVSHSVVSKAKYDELAKKKN
uniref:Secreted protein n=1 Tax=Heterorhabditis bacteriophora TaxID=37862 RepID=A0A1I7WUC9_HETBA